MSEDGVGVHLRAALAAVIAREAQLLTKTLDTFDDLHRQRVAGMQPLFALLDALALETATVPTISITRGGAGDNAQVKAGKVTIDISRTSLNALYQVDTCDLGPVTPSGHLPIKTSTTLSGADEVMALVISVVGKEMAVHQVVAARTTPGAV